MSPSTCHTSKELQRAKPEGAFRGAKGPGPEYCEKCVKPLSRGPVVPEQGSENVGVGTADSTQSGE